MPEPVSSEIASGYSVSKAKIIAGTGVTGDSDL